MIGNDELKINNEDLITHNRMYNGTEGLKKLLTSNTTENYS